MIFLAALRREIAQQWRSGITALYLGVPAFWGILLRLVPPDARGTLTPWAVYVDPALMGFLLSGALLARERDQGIFRALAVTPVGAARWLGSRVLVFSIQGVVGGWLLAGLAGSTYRPFLLAAAVAVLSTVGVLLGSAAGRPFRDLSGFIIVGGVASGLINLPAIAWMGWAKGFWMWLTPAMPGISAIGAAFDIPGPHIGAAAAIAVLLVWATVGFGLVLRIIDRGFFHRGRRP